MSRFSRVLLLTALILCASAQYSKGWIDLFEPPFEQCPTIMMAISCLSPTHCFVPGGSNGAGFDVFGFDGSIGGAFRPYNMPDMEMMMMAISVGGTEDAPHGAVGGFGIGNGVEYLKNKTTFEPALGPLFIVTQDIRSTAGGMEVLVIDGAATTAQVLYSADGGAVFETVNINTNMPNGSIPRYGAIPSASVWYVNSGSWPSHHHKGERSGVTSHHLSARVSLHMQNKNIKRISRRMDQHLATVTTNATGYTAVISKTSDGGKTWTNLVSDATNFYFNGIDCSSVTHCIAVGEGFDQDAAGHVYVTTDGTTFKETLRLVSNSSGAYSLMSVKFNGPNEAWIAGSFQSQSGSSGVFYYTNDGGNTWTSQPLMEYIGEVTDMSFTTGGVGFATALTMYDDSTILRYDDNGPTPTPGPTWLGNFTQIQCDNSKCTEKCTNFSFPQNTCLPLNGGGSAEAQCQPGVLMQTVYPLSANCQGPSQQQPQPLDQCLQAQSGYFENLCGPTARITKPGKQLFKKVK